MGDQGKKKGADSAKVSAAERRRKANEIIKEAEQIKPGETNAKREELEQRFWESENKRLKLAEALHASREQIKKLGFPGDEEEDRGQPFGVFVCRGSEKGTVVIRHHGRLYESKVVCEEEEPAPPAKASTLHDLRQQRGKAASQPGEFKTGELLLLNNDLQVLESRGFDLVCGCLGKVQQVLNEKKLLVKTAGDESLVLNRAHPLMNALILAGDNVEYDPDSLFCYSLLPKSEVDRLVLEKVPDISYEDIGGLEEVIEVIRDAVELPHLYPDYFREHRLVPPKGILLYGPPGCGKTLIAKAVANNLAKRVAEMSGEKGESYFLNVKGPELLNKYVGETEQAIRDIFARARNQASYRTPVIIFFDEMDSLFRVRGSGISSDMESTIVPQLLAELDGLDTLENVVVIGATNREDLIDPAVLRPGRLDRKILIPRPNRQAAMDIISKYLSADLPLDESLVKKRGGAEAAADWLRRQVVGQMYSLDQENQLIEITYADGSLKVLYMKDFCSGAIIENIVRRAKFMAIKDLIDKGRKGISLEHLTRALRGEYKENEDLPSNTNPAEWYRIIGKGEERVVRVRHILASDRAPKGGPEKARETIKVGDELS
jgi:proteasome-associated ATPase